MVVREVDKFTKAFRKKCFFFRITCQLKVRIQFSRHFIFSHSSYFAFGLFDSYPAIKNHITKSQFQKKKKEKNKNTFLMHKNKKNTLKHEVYFITPFIQILMLTVNVSNETNLSL